MSDRLLASFREGSIATDIEVRWCVYGCCVLASLAILHRSPSHGFGGPESQEMPRDARTGRSGVIREPCLSCVSGRPGAGQARPVLNSVLRSQNGKARSTTSRIVRRAAPTGWPACSGSSLLSGRSHRSARMRDDGGKSTLIRGRLESGEAGTCCSHTWPLVRRGELLTRDRYRNATLVFAEGTYTLMIPDCGGAKPERPHRPPKGPLTCNTVWRRFFSYQARDPCVYAGSPTRSCAVFGKGLENPNTKIEVDSRDSIIHAASRGVITD
jgi:hypothetical protein